MKTNLSLLINLLLSSTLFVGAQSFGGQKGVVRIPADTTSYCHMEFPPIVGESTPFAVNPLFNEDPRNNIDLYGSCDHDPLGVDEVMAERRLLRRGIYEDGE
jgi:hypothetical protein